MFILCPQCQFLVAIEPATRLPPARCPRCGHALRADDTTTASAPAPEPAQAPASAPTQEPAPAPARVPDAASTPADMSPTIPAHEPPPPADAVTVDIDALGEASVAASAEADWAAELASPEPSSTTAPPASTPAPAASTTLDEPAKPGKVAKPRKHAKTEKAEHAEKAGKPGKPPKPEKPARTENTARRARPAKPAKPKPEPPAEALQGDAMLQSASAARPVRRGHAPSFAQARNAPATALRWPTAATLAGLALLLALQFLIADRARLAADARWRPALESLCGVLRCTLPPWHEPDAFALVARDVRPTRRGVLRVSATFRNDARWTQAWPALHVALQDVDGRTVGARVFAPSEYRGPRQTQNGLAPGQVASVAFDIAEPGGTVVAFTFDFR